MQAARDDHRAAGAVVRDAKAALNVAKDALRDLDMNQFRKDEVCDARCRI